MNIGVIGTGNVGGTLGSRWARNGHSVIFGSRRPESDDVKSVIDAAVKTARAADLQQAVQSSDVLLLATPWPATQQVVQGLTGLRNKVLIDATNPIRPDLSGLETMETSAAEQIAQWAPDAKVVKAFNTVGAGIMANPRFGSERAVLFYCGDDAEAKKVVKQLADELGFDAGDAGALNQARVLEPFAMLWVSLALKYGYGLEFAFKLIQR
jgi:NADPH-dependent F420 reductase